VEHVTRLRAIAAAGTASLLAVGGIAAATSAPASATAPARQSIAGSLPPWVKASARASGTPLMTQTVSANIYLADRDPAGLAAFALDVSTPGARQYRHFITAAQAQARFGPTAAAGQAVRAWAASNGLTVTKSTTGFGAHVAVSGPATAAARAFGITFGNYRLDGRTVYAPNQAVSVPGSIASDVQTVLGLTNAPDTAAPDDTVKPGSALSAARTLAPGRTVKPDDTTPPGGALPPPAQNFFTAPPCSTFYGQLTATTVPGAGATVPAVDGKAQPWAICGYTPAQIRGAYHVAKSGETGKGARVAIVAAYASPTMLSDANQYAKATGDPGFNGKHGAYNQILLGGTAQRPWTKIAECLPPEWYFDETIDVQAVHGMAPDADVTYVGAASCSDADLADALAFIVNHHTADIVSNSWHEPADQDAIPDVFGAIMQAGAAEGIGFDFATGGMGYEDPNYQAASDAVQVASPADDPFATAVGGTTLGIGAKNNYQFETAFGAVTDPLVVPATGAPSFTFAPPATSAQVMQFYGGSSGGGVSAVYSQPAYQKGVVSRKLATTEVVTTAPQAPGDPFTEQVVTSKTPMRVIPDVSAIADFATGFLSGETLFGPDLNAPEQFFLSSAGGVGLAAPIWAGIQADAQQGAGGPLGFANPLIYSLARNNAKTHAFHDIVSRPDTFTVQDNFTNPNDPASPLVTDLLLDGVNGAGASALVATKGYDDTSGVGSPDFYIQALKRK
jgi:subtilase family serine protease